MAVYVVGSINVDIIAAVAHIPKPGETTVALSTMQAAGGKGANQAVAAALMGAECWMIGTVGADSGGAWMRDEIGKRGVHTDGISTTPDLPTGAAYIAVDAVGENQIIVAPGANHAALAPSPINTGVLLAQLELPINILAPLFAASKGALRILNAAPAHGDVRPMLTDVDVLIVNEHELAALANIPTNGSLFDAARSLMSRHDQRVIVTLGGEGLIAVDADTDFNVPAFPVTTVDTIGAGDCFCGAFAALIDGGTEFDSALRLASAAAALCTQTPGAIPAMPPWDAVQAFVGEYAV